MEGEVAHITKQEAELFTRRMEDLEATKKMLHEANLHLGTKAKEAEERAATYVASGRELHAKYSELVMTGARQVEAAKAKGHEVQMLVQAAALVEAKMTRQVAA